MRASSGHGDASQHLVLLDALHEHLPLEISPEIRHRHVFLLERGLELLLGLDLVVLLDVRENALELLLAQLVPELLPSLHHEHFIDDGHDEIRCHLVEHLAELRIGRIALQIDLLAELLPKGGDLTRLEVAFRENLAVYLHQNLLDHFGPGHREGAGEQQERNERASEVVDHGCVTLSKPIFYT